MNLLYILKYPNFYKEVPVGFFMAKSIENKFKVGDWVRPNPDTTNTKAKYYNVTKRNVGRFNEKPRYDFDKDKYFLVEGEEIKEAENYLKSLIEIKVGDYVDTGGGVIDRISKVPKIENPFEIDSYGNSVDTERGNWLWHLSVPGAKVSKEEAKQYFLNMKNSHLNSVALFDKQLKDLEK